MCFGFTLPADGVAGGKAKKDEVLICIGGDSVHGIDALSLADDTQRLTTYSTMQVYFYAWSRTGLLAHINHKLVMALREKVGRQAKPDGGRHRQPIGQDDRERRPDWLRRRENNQRALAGAFYFDWAQALDSKHFLLGTPTCYWVHVGSENKSDPIQRITTNLPPKSSEKVGITWLQKVRNIVATTIFFNELTYDRVKSSG